MKRDLILFGVMVLLACEQYGIYCLGVANGYAQGLSGLVRTWSFLSGF